jgi:Mg-chelatase subunit ChlD
MRELEKFTPSIDSRNRKGGDLTDGLRVAMNMLERHCGTKKYRKRVFLITDGEKAVESREKLPLIQD